MCSRDWSILKPLVVLTYFLQSTVFLFVMRSRLAEIIRYIWKAQAFDCGFPDIYNSRVKFTGDINCDFDRKRSKVSNSLIGDCRIDIVLAFHRLEEAGVYTKNNTRAYLP